jgi:MFS family permease
MQKFDILLQKRSGKLLIYLGAAAFIAPMAIALVGGIFHEFHWYLLLLAVLVFFGVYLIFGALVEYFFYKDVRLVVESDGQTIKFYNTNSAGKVFNESEEFKLDEMARFYTVEKSTRYLLKNHYFEFEGKSSLSLLLKEEVECFPKLYEATGEDRRNVLEFVQSVAPDIQLGYENLWKRLTK